MTGIGFVKPPAEEERWVAATSEADWAASGVLCVGKHKVKCRHAFVLVYCFGDEIYRKARVSALKVFVTQGFSGYPRLPRAWYLAGSIHDFRRDYQRLSRLLDNARISKLVNW